MGSDGYDIQDLVRASGIPRRTIHFYVQQGILPPPEGAGLAARYREEHLTRLRLIPIYRQRGMRLDDIRAQFNKMDANALQKVMQEVQGAAQAASRDAGHAVQLPGRGKKDRQAITQPGPVVPRVVREQMVAPVEFGEERVRQYGLPAGIRLLVPETVSIRDRQRVQMLIQAARQIFSGEGGEFYASGDPTKNEQPDPKEE